MALQIDRKGCAVFAAKAIFLEVSFSVTSPISKFPLRQVSFWLGNALVNFSRAPAQRSPNVRKYETEVAMDLNTLVLFGAGATKACGGPLTNEILSRRRSGCECGLISSARTTSTCRSSFSSRISIWRNCRPIGPSPTIRPFRCCLAS